MSAPGPSYHWSGFDYESGCNLCATWQPHPRSDERLLNLEPFTKFCFTASLYRDREQGRVLVEEWARRRGREADIRELLHIAELA